MGIGVLSHSRSILDANICLLLDLAQGEYLLVTILITAPPRGTAGLLAGESFVVFPPRVNIVQIKVVVELASLGAIDGVGTAAGYHVAFTVGVASGGVDGRGIAGVHALDEVAAEGRDRRSDDGDVLFDEGPDGEVDASPGEVRSKGDGSSFDGTNNSSSGR